MDQPVDHPCNCTTCTNELCPVFSRKPPITEEMIRRSRIADEVDKARALIFLDSTGWIGCMYHPLALQVLAGPVIEELNNRASQAEVVGGKGLYILGCVEAIHFLEKGVRKKP